MAEKANAKSESVVETDAIQGRAHALPGAFDEPSKPAVFNDNSKDIEAGNIDTRSLGPVSENEAFQESLVSKDDDMEDPARAEDHKIAVSNAEGDQLSVADTVGPGVPWNEETPDDGGIERDEFSVTSDDLVEDEDPPESVSKPTVARKSRPASKPTAASKSRAANKTTAAVESKADGSIAPADSRAAAKSKGEA